MGCFESLVKSHFLANVTKELSLARNALQSMNLTQLPIALPNNKKVRKDVYDDYVYYYYLIEEMIDTLKESTSADTIYYMQMDHIIFVYTLDYSQFKDAIRYSHNLNGDIPYHKSKHRIAGCTMYTALYDTRLCFTPFSIN